MLPVPAIAPYLVAFVAWHRCVTVLPIIFHDLVRRLLALLQAMLTPKALRPGRTSHPTDCVGSAVLKKKYGT